MGMPDYSGTFRLGGLFSEIPKPHIRLFPGPKKRRVTIKIGTYVGIGSHSYVTIEEESNPVWNSAENVWQVSWDKSGDRDAEGEGLQFNARFAHYSSALRWAKRKCLEYFHPDTHEISMCYSTKKQKWFYKQGD